VQVSQACLIIAPQGGILGKVRDDPAENCQMPCSIPVCPRLPNILETMERHSPSSNR
jgi:hypothetical protein